MKRRLSIGMFMCALFQVCNVVAANADSGKLSWHLNEGPEAEMSLFFGSHENDELLEIVFSCQSGTGSVTVQLMESSDQLKPGNAACITLAVKDTKTEFCGAAVPNELAGVAGIEAIAPINAPVFSELKGAGSLAIHFKGGKRSIPLAKIGDKASAFHSKCVPQF